MHLLSEEKLLVLDKILILVNRELKLKYNSTAMGYIWSLMNPIFLSFIYYIVFRKIIRFDLKNYMLFVLSGVFLWQFFVNAVIGSGITFFSNSWLIKKTSVPPIYLVMGTFFTELFHFLLTIPILLCVMLISKVPITWNFLLLPIAILCIGGMTFGVALIYATVNVFIRDLERMILLLFQVWMFLCPVMIPLKYVPKEYQIYILLNPMTPFLNAWRSIFFEPDSLELMPWVISMPISILAVIVGLFVYHSLEKNFAEMV